MCDIKETVRYSYVFPWLMDLSDPGEHSSSFCINKLKCAWSRGDLFRMGMSVCVQLQGCCGFFSPGVNIAVSGLKVSCKCAPTDIWFISCLSSGHNKISSSLSSTAFDTESSCRKQQLKKNNKDRECFQQTCVVMNKLLREKDNIVLEGMCWNKDITENFSSLLVWRKLT